MARFTNVFTFRRLQRADRGTILINAMGYVIDNETSVRRKFEGAYLGPRDTGSKSQQKKTPENKIRNIIQSVVFVNDSSRQFIRKNMKNVLCWEHHARRSENASAITARKISCDTERLMRKIIYHVKLLKRGQTDKTDNEVDEALLEVFWFVDRLLEMQRQTYGF